MWAELGWVWLPMCGTGWGWAEHGVARIPVSLAGRTLTVRGGVGYARGVAGWPPYSALPPLPSTTSRQPVAGSQASSLV